MGISVILDEEQSRRLQELAEKLRVDPESLARAAIAELTGRVDDDFERAAKRVLEKNKELYRRLS